MISIEIDKRLRLRAKENLQGFTDGGTFCKWCLFLFYYTDTSETEEIVAVSVGAQTNSVPGVFRARFLVKFVRLRQ